MVAILQCAPRIISFSMVDVTDASIEKSRQFHYQLSHRALMSKSAQLLLDQH
jgi:hypothetical protein